MKSLVSLIVFAGLALAACNPPTAPKPTQYCTFISFDVPPDCSEGPSQNANAQATLDSVSVSPTVVRAGDHFTASARATVAHCNSVSQITIDYANDVYNGNPPSLTVSLTAVFGDTVLTFEAECGLVFAPVKTRIIQVLPAQ